MATRATKSQVPAAADSVMDVMAPRMEILDATPPLLKGVHEG